MSDSSQSQRKGILQRLLACESGTVVTTELVVVTVAAVIGLVVALTAVRDSVVSEFVDTALAIQNTNQSFSQNGTSSVSSSTAGFDFVDQLDANDGEDIAGAVLGVDFTIEPGNELTLAEVLQSRTFRSVITRFGATFNGTASFSEDGRFNGSPFWPGNYVADGTTVTINFDPLGFGWTSGTAVLDASDTRNLTGEIVWINTIFNFVWRAGYQLLAN